MAFSSQTEGRVPVISVSIWKAEAGELPQVESKLRREYQTLLG